MTFNDPVSVTSEERTWGMLAHLLAGVALFTGLFSWLPPLVVWLIKRDQSRFVAFHALQSFYFQLLWLAVMAVLGGIAFALVFVLIGLLLLPLVASLICVPMIWSVVAAVKANNGEWYQYPLAGQWALKTLGP